MEKTNSNDLLEKLIQLRCKAIETIIKNESPHSVRHRIKLSVKLLSDTVALIHSCFISKYLRYLFIFFRVQIFIFRIILH